jgi:hypothetical protein
LRTEWVIVIGYTEKTFPENLILLSAHLDSIFFEFRHHHVFILKDRSYRLAREFALIPGPTVVG